MKQKENTRISIKIETLNALILNRLMEIIIRNELKCRYVVDAICNAKCFGHVHS